jgi:hypothetical protein
LFRCPTGGWRWRSCDTVPSLLDLDCGHRLRRLSLTLDRLFSRGGESALRLGQAAVWAILRFGWHIGSATWTGQSHSILQLFEVVISIPKATLRIRS